MTTQQQILDNEAATGPPPGMDINAETYPFDVVVSNLDKAAYFHFYSAPERGARGSSSGMRICETLHRFDTPLYAPPGSDSLRAANVIGESLASFESRWMLMPDWMQARPGMEPDSEPFDTSRPRRFVMLDGICRFGGGRDGFEGFGSGMTAPGPDNAGPVPCGAVGTILRGFGKFEGLVGTYTYVGTLCPQTGFRGSVLLRVIDPDGRFEGRSPPLLKPADFSEPGVTYIVFRGQKKDRSAKTGFLTGAGGQVVGLLVTQQLRIMDPQSGRPHGHPVAHAQIGPVIGEMNARIKFNLTDPGAPGSAEAPIPFLSANDFTFYDSKGGVLGTLSSSGGEGRTFRLQLAGVPRQAALRFGAFLPITGGTGCFEGVRGMMTDNSAVGIAPHAVVTFYVLRIDDPKGKFRARFQNAWEL